MHVAVKSDFPLPAQILYHLFAVVDARVQKFIRDLPLTVQITPQQAAPVVTMHHAVRVQHRNNFKHKMPSQLHSKRFIRQNKLQSSIQHVTCLWLPRMHTTRQHDSLLGAVVSHVLNEL